MVNLNSRSATHVTDIRFKSAHQHDFPIVIFKTPDVQETCHTIRTWLHNSVVDPEDLETLRMDDQDLETMAPHLEGQLVWLADAATLGGRPENPISIFAIFIPSDDRTWWFWTLLNPSSLLFHLAKEELIGPPIPVQPTSQKHGGMYTFLMVAFTTATRPPHHPDFMAAAQLVDYCPPIRDPETACRRIEASVYLWFNGQTGGDLEDDRYVLEVEPAERELVSVMEMRCAEYLLYKRRYFKQLAYEVVHNSEKVRQQMQQRQQQRTGSVEQVVDTPMAETSAPTPRGGDNTLHDARARAARTGAKNRKQQVRTENAHIRLIEAEKKWAYKKSKQLYVGWKILGFLDEARVLRIAEAGGVAWDEDDEEEDGSEAGGDEHEREDTEGL